jgi:hypothetical protein
MRRRSLLFPTSYLERIFSHIQRDVSVRAATEIPIVGGG